MVMAETPGGVQARCLTDTGREKNREESVNEKLMPPQRAGLSPNNGTGHNPDPGPAPGLPGREGDAHRVARLQARANGGNE